MKDFLKATGSAFVGCFFAIWAFGKCKNSICKKDDNFERVAKKVAEKVEELQTTKEEKQPEQQAFVEVEVEKEEPKSQAVKRERVVSGATEVAQGIY
jgi:hypothetical protein